MLFGIARVTCLTVSFFRWWSTLSPEGVPAGFMGFAVLSAEPVVIAVIKNVNQKSCLL